MLHRDETAIRIKNRDVALSASRLQPGESVTVPDAPFVCVARGTVELEGAEVLIWEMHATVR